MTSHEELMQQQIEDGKPLSANADSRAYQKVFDTLKQEPDFVLPAHFEDKIIQRIEASQKLSERKETYWLMAGVSVMIIASIIGAVLVGFKPSFGAFAFLSRYTGLFIFGIAFVILLQWLDRKIVHRHSL
ncbi:MAG: hypothetical protein HYZ44_09565 [Bacteroidetes bacterium]|nr:hypothetical protein [Bacteroidota bacterium]